MKITPLIVLAFMASVAVAHSLPGPPPAGAEDLSFEHRVVDDDPPKDPWTKIAGDVDGDGRPDIVIGGQNGPLVWYRNPDWTRHEIAPGGYQTVDGELGDVDGDEDLDVVMGGTVWFENPGDLGDRPGQGWKQHVIADHPTHDVEIADFDGDGRLDVVTRNQTEWSHAGHTIHVFLQVAPDAWQEVVLECPEGEGLTTADLDEDGDTDIVIGGIWFESVREGGRVAWRRHSYGRYAGSASVGVGDVNGDGRPDVVAAPSELAGQRGRVAWFEAPGNPRSEAWSEHSLVPDQERVVHSLRLADVDGDGLLDIVFAEMHQGEDPDEVGVFLNREAGTIWRKHVVAETGSHGLRVVDIDGDGDTDLVGANWSGEDQPIELWVNRAATPSTEGH